MDYIYKLMMQPHLEAQPPFCGHEVKSAYGMLPHARRGAIAGLLEPLEFFRDILQEHFPDDEVQRQIDTALN